MKFLITLVDLEFCIKTLMEHEICLNILLHICMNVYVCSMYACWWMCMYAYIYEHASVSDLWIWICLCMKYMRSSACLRMHLVSVYLCPSACIHVSGSLFKLASSICSSFTCLQELSYICKQEYKISLFNVIHSPFHKNTIDVPLLQAQLVTSDPSFWQPSLQLPQPAWHSYLIVCKEINFHSPVILCNA